jgi:hypothetical protein
LIPQLLGFLMGFVEWINSLTWVDFILIFWPLLIIDFLRAILKVAIIIVVALCLSILKSGLGLILIFSVVWFCSLTFCHYQV